MPVQDRGKRRREGLLDAGAMLIERSGLLALNTGALAAEAGASVGTVYEYFPNKEAIIGALLERYQERLRSRLTSAVDPGLGFQAVLSSAVDAFYDFYRNEPGYRGLWLGAQLSEQLVRAGAHWAEDFVAWIDPLLVRYAPHLEPPKRSTVARVVIHLVGSLLTFAVRAPVKQQRAIVAETKFALECYLAAYAKLEAADGDPQG